MRGTIAMADELILIVEDNEKNLKLTQLTADLASVPV